MFKYEIGIALGERFRTTVIESNKLLSNEAIINVIMQKAHVSYRFMLQICNITRIA